jgi:hypothetical protein
MFLRVVIATFLLSVAATRPGVLSVNARFKVAVLHSRFRKMLQKFPSLISLFSDFKDSEIWEAIEAKRSGAEQDDGSLPDIKLPEWRVFSNPD